MALLPCVYLALLPCVYLALLPCVYVVCVADKDMFNWVQSPSLKIFQKRAKIFLEAGLHVYLLYVYVKVSQ